MKSIAETVHFRLTNIELFFSTVNFAEAVAVEASAEGFLGISDFIEQLVERLKMLMFVCFTIETTFIYPRHHKNLSHTGIRYVFTCIM